MIDFKNGKYFDYPFPYMIMENCFDKKTLENLINEFPDVEKESASFGGRKQMSISKNHANPKGKLITNEKFKDWIRTTPSWNKL